MFDNLLGDDDEESPSDGTHDDDGSDEMDDLFSESSSGSGDDPLLDGDGSDESGGHDSSGSDATGGGVSPAVENRLDELETEVDSVSSTLDTVRSENQQISGSIDDVEENIRKLLEVYDMVTRGVNPFVNEEEIGDAFGSTTGERDDRSIELFDEEAENDNAELDESVASADAEEFFDDDFDDVSPEEEEEKEEGDDDASGEADASLDSEQDEELETSKDNDEQGEDGQSFEDLKSRYESESPDINEEPHSDDTLDDEEEVKEADPESNGGTASGNAEETAIPGSDSRSLPGKKPYIDAVPAGYVTDLIVMDWLEYLVEEAGIDGAARTIAYYEAIGWLSSAAGETLHTYLHGFGDEVASNPDAQSPLTVAHHNTSLHYISRIVNPSPDLLTGGGSVSPFNQTRGRMVTAGNESEADGRPWYADLDSYQETGQDDNRMRHSGQLLAVESDGGQSPAESHAVRQSRGDREGGASTFDPAASGPYWTDTQLDDAPSPLRRQWRSPVGTRTEQLERDQ